MHESTTSPPYILPSRRLARRVDDIPAARFVGPAAALLYPFWLDGFHFCVERLAAARGLYAALLLLSACALFVLANATPAVAAIAFASLARKDLATRSHLRAVRVALLAVAAVPIYTFVGVIFYMAGLSGSDRWVVSMLWTIMIVLLALPGSEIASSQSRPVASWLKVHRLLGLTIAIFVLGHEVNHLLGLVGPDAHLAAMKALRKIYRLPVVEPAIAGAFLSTAATGGYLAWWASAKRMDGFRAFQLMSGVFLFFFIISHLNAVFVLARTYLGIDSNWDFATGTPAGLILDPWNIRLVPHYGWGAFFALGHVFVAIRYMMLRRGASKASADRVAVWGAVASGVVAILILLGMCGVRPGFV